MVPNKDSDHKYNTISDPGKSTTMWGYVIDYQVEGETGKFWIMSLASNSPLRPLANRIFELMEIKE